MTRPNEQRRVEIGCPSCYTRIIVPWGVLRDRFTVVCSCAYRFTITDRTPIDVIPDDAPIGDLAVTLDEQVGLAIVWSRRRPDRE